jgi:hypothetical protein
MTEKSSGAEGAEKNVKYGQAITAASPERFVVCDMPLTEMEGKR